jgi:hypothetical protein
VETHISKYDKASILTVEKLSLNFVIYYKYDVFRLFRPVGGCIFGTNGAVRVYRTLSGLIQKSEMGLCEVCSALTDKFDFPILSQFIRYNM